MQTINARHNGLNNEDMRQKPHHGKNRGDVAAAAVGVMARNSCFDNYGGGNQNLVRCLTFKHPCPNIERHTRYYRTRGLYICYYAIHIDVYPPGCIDDDVAAVDEGYSGSSKDYALLLLSWSNHRGVKFDAT